MFNSGVDAITWKSYLVEKEAQFHLLQYKDRSASEFSKGYPVRRLVIEKTVQSRTVEPDGACIHGSTQRLPVSGRR